MASLLRPFANLVAPGPYQVPVGAVGIDWTKPLTRGLIGCWLPGVSYGIDISKQTPDLTVQVNAKFTTTAEGPCLWSDNAASGDDDIRGTATAPFKSLGNAGGAFSIYWRGAITSQIANGSNPLICGVTYDNVGSTGPFVIAAIAPLSGGQYPGISLYYGSAGTISHMDITGIVNNFNVMYSFGGVFDISANLVTFYNNGVSAGTPVGYGSPSNVSATSQIVIGGDGHTTAVSSHCQTNIGCFWNRALSAGEMYALNLDPYGFLAPAEYDLPALLVPPAVPKFRGTLSPIGTRAGSRQLHNVG